jgi:hypothetical protein
MKRVRRELYRPARILEAAHAAEDAMFARINFEHQDIFYHWIDNLL